MPARLLVVLLIAAAASAQVPTPESHFGHRMGADRKLVDWDDVAAYYRRVAAASDRVQVQELGRSTEGRPFLLVTVASPETLGKLDEYKEIQRKLSDPRLTSAEEAQELAAKSKAVVLITCSIHSTEVASTMTAIEYLHQLVTEDTRRNRAILDNVIFLLVPSLNPDGVDKVADWYRQWLGTPYEGAPMNALYHRYLGHDNNRDWYIFSQQETRLAVDKVHNVWRPQVVYDVHQMGTSGARMFVPPWTDPVDPNIDPLITQQVNAFGLGMAADLTASGKTGVVVNGIYDYFTPARHYQSYHGGLRLLSESASARYASPVTTPFSTLQTRARGYNAQQTSWNFLEPWAGGTWRLRDIVDYQLVAFESVLYQAALKRHDLLVNFHRILQRVMNRPGPQAFVIPRNQHDPAASVRLLQTLHRGMVEIDRAQTAFRADGAAFAEGDIVIRMRQPYAAFARTLLEEQRYPDLREYPGGPPRRPYDVTAHSLPLLMGVEARPINRLPSDLQLSKVTKFLPPGRVSNAQALRLSAGDSNSFIAVNRLLKAGVEVFRDLSAGDFLISRSEAGPERLESYAKELGLRFDAADASPGRQVRVRPARIGLYAGARPSMDEGWTRWLLEQYEFNLERVDNPRIQAGGLRSRYDVVILADASPSSLHAGYVEGATYSGAKAPPVATGGIEDAGAQSLRRFAEAGGTILTFNRASSYALERLGLPIEDVLDGVSNRQFYAPGSLLNALVDTDEPLTWGTREREAVWFESGPAFRFKGGDQRGSRPKALLRYPARDVLASGWLLGERYLAGEAAVVECPVGTGKVVLFGIRPQYRGQSNATFRLVFNALLGA